MSLMEWIDPINRPLIIGAGLLLISILGSKLTVRLGVPTLIFFIFVGIIFSKVWGLHSDPEMNISAFRHSAKMVGIITLTFILFYGGLETDIGHVKPIWRSGILLSTVGALTTALTVGFFLYLASGKLDLTLPQGILVGAIVASTDAAAVFSILRSQKIKLKANIAPLLELESGSNDVMVYFLMTFLISFIGDPSASIWKAIPTFFLEMIIGGIGGLITGHAMVWMLNKINLTHKGLYAPLTLAMVFLSYGLVDTLHGSGYLAVYIAGIVLGNRDFIQRRSILKFYEGFGWMLQITMFIALGLLVDLNTLLEVAPIGIALSIFLMLFARPLSILLSLIKSPFTRKQKVFISWVGLRGAVPIVFATYLYGREGDLNDNIANKLFHLIFFIVIVSVLIQGSTLHPLAKKLKLEKEEKHLAKRKKQGLEIDEEVKKMLMQLEIPLGSPIADKPIVNIGLPKGAFIVLICRENHYLVARGSTVLHAYDKLFFIVNTKKELKEVRNILRAI